MSLADPSPFHFDGHLYPTTEHYVQVSEARHFKDAVHRPLLRDTGTGQKGQAMEIAILETQTYTQPRYSAIRSQVSATPLGTNASVVANRSPSCPY